MPQARTFSGQSSRVRTTLDYLANSTELTGRTYDYDNNLTTGVKIKGSGFVVCS